MLIVDDNKEVFQWIQDLNNDQIGAAHLDSATFELANGIESELIMMSATTFNTLNKPQREKLKKCSALIIFNLKDIELAETTENIVAVVNTQTNKNIIVQQIVNLENFVKTNNQLKSQLISLNMELNEVIGGVEDQLLRVKHAYEKVAPRRLEKFQGFKIYSKYAAGDDLGGEFFDLLAKEDKVFVMMSATSSYLASSSILQTFAELKKEKTITKKVEEAFILKVQSQIEELAASQAREIKAQIMTCILNIKTLEIQGHVFGNFKVMSSNTKHNVEFTNSLSMEFEQVRFKRKIKRGERIMLCSPGFLVNWASLNPNFMIEELMMNKKVKVLDILDEVYFQLKKDTTSGFLKSDASAIIMEVQENAVLQV